jgi:NDP-sugar pyrophosphorylase family protein
MRSITKDEIPKALLAYGSKTILEHQAEWLKRYGVERVVLCTGFRKEVIREFLAKRNLDVKIEFSEENEPLGTGGAVKNAGRMSSTFLIIYGDIALGMNLDRLLAFHFSKNSTLTLVLHESDHPYDSDLVDVSESGLIKRFIGKPDPIRPLPTKLTKTSVYVAEPELFDFLPDRGSLERLAIPAMIERGKCFGYVTSEFVRDVGTPDRYENQ